MLRERILEVLNDWNFWRRDQPTGILRERYLRRMRELKGSSILILMGVRRSGKSTLMRQYLKKLIENGLSPNNTLFINLEEPRFSSSLSPAFLYDIYETYLQYLQPDGRPFIFLDEVQNVPGWERFVRALHEREVAHIIVSGSSSKLLSAELGSLLTGRYLSIEVLPLGFDEFLTFKGVPIRTELDLAQHRLRIIGLLKEYIEYGGFPEVVLSKVKKELLMNYFNDIISRDITQRYGIRKIKSLQTLAHYYLTSIASPITFNRIKKFLNLPLDTVERFSYYLEYAYLIFLVTRYSRSLKHREKSPRKVYSIDTGLRNVICLRPTEDYGRNLENIVFLELRRRRYDIYYWKDNYGWEVDFVLRTKGGLDLIQVCWDVENIEVRQRELRALRKAMGELSVPEGTVITAEFEGEERHDDRKIKFIPLWRWLLHPKT